jgi:VWFA-related protein
MGVAVRRNPHFALLALLSIATITIGQSAPPAPQSPSATPQNVLREKSRLVTVDVVATDSHGTVVRDLKPEDFEVSDGTRQTIEKFLFVDRSTENPSAKPAAPRPNGFYTNQPLTTDLAVPATVILMDALNTNPDNMLETRQQMLRLLKTLPANTPVAVFLLGKSLLPIQNFTSDPAVLRAAVDKAMAAGPTLPQSPENDPQSISLLHFDMNDGQEDEQLQELEDFEKENYANTMDIRMYTTIDALTAIAHYLSAFPGRKNLVWVSESFPLTLVPDLDFGTSVGAFRGVRDYSQQLLEASNALTDARVAVYPVDARGLDTIAAFSASTQTVVRTGSASRSIPRQIVRENTARDSAQQTMNELAEDSGGKTCKGTNDLSGCVAAALRDSSSYYEISYDPQGVRWDGSFRKISLKTTRPGVKLSYRRGYFAQDEGASEKSLSPEKRLDEACTDFLPSSSIPLTAQAVDPIGAGESRYLVVIPPSTLNPAADGQSYQLNAQMAICRYPAKQSGVQVSIKDISQTYSDADYKTLQSSGVHGFENIQDAGAQRARIAVLDLNSGLTGAVDVPLMPVSPAAAHAASTTSPAVPGSAPANPSAHSPADTSVALHAATGQSGTLDWGNGKLVYQGDLGIEQGAPAFFKYFLGADFHCGDEGLVANDAKPGHEASYLLGFTDDSGHIASVNLKGDQPEYSGDLPVDPSAKPFFQRLWYSYHCRAAP